MWVAVARKRIVKRRGAGAVGVKAVSYNPQFVDLTPPPIFKDCKEWDCW